MRKKRPIPRTLEIAAAFEGAKYGHVAGDIVTFRGDGSPLRALTVGVEPVQDLHGYDYPWPAGGGKNKLIYPYGYTTYETNGCTCKVQSDGTVTFSGTPSANALFNIKQRTQSTGGYAQFLPEGNYILNGCPTGGNTTTYQISVIDSTGTAIAVDRGSGASFSVPEGGMNVGVQLFVASGYNPNSLKMSPMIRLASVIDPTFAPYSNICPITGHTGANVWRTGKNLLSKGESSSSNGIMFTVQETGEVIITGTASGNAFWGVQFTLPAGSYVMNGCPQGGSGNYLLTVRETVGGNTISGIPIDNGNGSSFTLTQPLTAYVNIRVASGYACPTGGIKLSPMIRLASETDDTFAPYTGTTIPITWQSTAGTVYGGYVDLVSGEVWAEYAYHVFTGDEQFYNAGTWVSCFGNFLRAAGQMIGVCSHYPYGAYGRGKVGVMYNGVGCVFDGNIYNADGWKQYCQDQYENSTPLQISYKAATPTLIATLTPRQIKTLKGINNIYSDADSAEVTYYKHNNDTYQHVPADAIISNDNFVIITDDKYVIGNNQDYITY